MQNLAKLQSKRPKEGGDVSVFISLSLSLSACTWGIACRCSLMRVCVCVCVCACVRVRAVDERQLALDEPPGHDRSGGERRHEEVSDVCLGERRLGMHRGTVCYRYIEAFLSPSFINEQRDHAHHVTQLKRALLDQQVRATSASHRSRTNTHAVFFVLL